MRFSPSVTPLTPPKVVGPHREAGSVRPYRYDSLVRPPWARPYVRLVSRTGGFPVLVSPGPRRPSRKDTPPEPRHDPLGGRSLRHSTPSSPTRSLDTTESPNSLEVSDSQGPVSVSSLSICPGLSPLVSFEGVSLKTHRLIPCD